MYNFSIMKRYILSLTFAATLLSISGCNSTLTRHHFEIADTNLKTISQYRADRDWVSAVLYNPMVCEDMGDACIFFLTQAHAHFMNNDVPLPPQQYAKFHEDRADCWAARYAEPEVVRAAVDWLRAGDFPEGIFISGEPMSRANNIQQCAEKFANWQAG